MGCEGMYGRLEGRLADGMSLAHSQLVLSTFVTHTQEPAARVQDCLPWNYPCRSQANMMLNSGSS
eukprot:12912689-Prorocentrum_lima.AAC.1